MAELDPRWEWYEVTKFGDAEPQYMKLRCNHLDVVPVEDVFGERVIAHLCLTCDAQLPEWFVTR